jgi:GT2 family glycosyltransferase
MKIDFILPIKVDDDKRVELLAQTLTTFFLTVDTNKFNRLIVINDQSTHPEIEELFSRPEFIVNPLIVINYNQTQLGVGGSKNRGVELARQFGEGDALYFMDGDVFYTWNWLEKVLEAYDKYKDDFKIIAGGVHPYLRPRFSEDNVLLTSHDAISGWSWFLDYNTWDKYGKLADNSLGTGKSEDWEYCQRIRNDGYKVGCLKNQVIAHCGITNTEGNQIPGYRESIDLANSITDKAILL